MLQLQIGFVLLLIVSSCLLIVAYRMGRSDRSSLAHRVDLIAITAPVAAAETVTAPPRTRPPGWIDEATRRLFCVGLPYRWGMRSGGGKILALATVAAAVVGLLAYRALGHSAPLAIALAALAFALVPRQILKREQAQAERQFMDLFPNAIDMIVRMLRSGLPIVSAMRVVATESPPPFSTVFALIAEQVDVGVPFEKALDMVSERLGIQELRFFSVAVTLQYTTGGNLAATLDILADVIRKRRAVRLKAIAATAEVRISTYVLGGMPILTIVALMVLNPSYVAPLLYDPRGKFVVGAAVGLLSTGIFIMRRLMRRVTEA